jgi:tetratricopeptide (TPR) repeat protein
MKKSVWIVLLFVPVLLLQAQSIESCLSLGDSLKDKWDHDGAAKAYLEAVGLDSNHYIALWNAADEVTEMANALPETEKDQKEELFARANALATRAIEVNPDGWEGHFYKAVALGRLALFRGGKEKINLSKAIKVETDKAIELNPNADLAYHVLGRWHQNLANLSWVLRAAAKVMYGGVPPGSNEESVAAFEKAISIDPNHIEHYLELARTYEFMGKKELMREPLEKVLALPSIRSTFFIEALGSRAFLFRIFQTGFQRTTAENIEICGEKCKR